jgi:hypothetical protein
MGSPISVGHERAGEQVNTPSLLAAINVLPNQFRVRTDEGLGEQLRTVLVQTCSISNDVFQAPVCRNKAVVGVFPE